MLNLFFPSPGFATRFWLAMLSSLSGSSGLHTPTVLCNYLLQVVYT